MFTTNYISLSDYNDSNCRMLRHNVPCGAVFTYVNGRTTTPYCALGVIMRNMDEGSGKSPDASSANWLSDLASDRAFFVGMKTIDGSARITVTPTASAHINKECQIIGAFSWALTYNEVASIRPLKGSDNHSFGKILTLHGATDTTGNSHIFIMLGKDVDPRVEGHLLLRVTRDDREQSQKLFHVLEDHSLVAVRGEATLHFKYR